MSIPQVVFAELRALVADRVYPNTFLQPGGALPIWPSIRYTISNSDSEGALCGTDTQDTDDVSVQIDVVASTYPAMLALKVQVIAALLETFPPCLREPGGFETYDTDTKTHRAVLSYLFQQSSVTP